MAPGPYRPGGLAPSPAGPARGRAARAGGTVRGAASGQRRQLPRPALVRRRLRGRGAAGDPDGARGRGDGGRGGDRAGGRGGPCGRPRRRLARRPPLGGGVRRVARPRAGRGHQRHGAGPPGLGAGCTRPRGLRTEHAGPVRSPLPGLPRLLPRAAVQPVPHDDELPVQPLPDPHLHGIHSRGRGDKCARAPPRSRPSRGRQHGPVRRPELAGSRPARGARARRGARRGLGLRRPPVRGAQSGARHVRSRGLLPRSRHGVGFGRHPARRLPSPAHDPLLAPSGTSSDPRRGGGTQ